MIIIKHSIRYGLIIAIIVLSGCSTINNDDYVYQRPQTRNLPEIPEIASVRVPPPAPRYTPPPVKPQVQAYKPEVHKYTPNKTSNTVITQKEVATVSQGKKWEAEIKQKAEVETDPYANIPDDSTGNTNSTDAKPKVTNTSIIKPRGAPVLGSKKPVKPPKPSKPQPPIESSSAVKTLLIKARADLAIGRTSSAIDKLERGLRIEPQNSLLWYQLAKANYDKETYTQTISMAKKSIRNTDRDYIIAKNWMLIKKAGLKSGDTVVVKEAIDYFKLNP